MDQPDLERVLCTERELRLIKSGWPHLFRWIVRGAISFFRDSENILVELAVPVLIVEYRNRIHSLRNPRKDDLSTHCLRIDLSPLGAKRIGCIAGEALPILEQGDADLPAGIARVDDSDSSRARVQGLRRKSRRKHDRQQHHHTRESLFASTLHRQV
jgi:hypothetical protein